MGLEALKEQLCTQLVPADRLKTPPGVTTGHAGLDQFLLWNGFPKGELSLLYGSTGFGATSLWVQSAAQLTQKNLWAAWVNSSHMQLCPWTLRQRQVRLARLFCVHSPPSLEELLWALQELMSLSLFELIGCDLGDFQLREHQVLKLRKLAARHKVAMVFLSGRKVIRPSAFYALIIQFQRGGFFIERAQHRPTPHFLTRRQPYADLMSQLASQRKTLGRRALSRF